MRDLYACGLLTACWQSADACVFEAQGREARALRGAVVNCSHQAIMRQCFTFALAAVLAAFVSELAADTAAAASVSA